MNLRNLLRRELEGQALGLTFAAYTFQMSEDRSGEWHRDLNQVVE